MLLFNTAIWLLSDFVTNDEIHSRTEQPVLSNTIHNGCLSFFGHLSHADPWQDHHRALQACMLGPPGDWRRRIGWPRQSWLRTIENELRPVNLGLATVKRRALDRSTWRLLMTTAMSMTSSWMTVIGNNDGRWSLWMWMFLFNSIVGRRSVKGKGKAGIAVHGTPSHSYGVSLAIWDHTVLPATRHKSAHPAFTPASQAGTRFTYHGGIEGWVDLGDLLHTEMVYPPADGHPSRY